MFSQFIAPAIGFGLSATSVPGPLQAFLINITLRYGWRRGLLVVLCPLIVDLPIILVVVFLLGQLPDVAIQGIRLLGGILLLWIARGAWLQYRAGADFATDADDEQQIVASPREILTKGVMMNVVSPGPYLFWGTVTGPMLLETLEQSLLHAGLFMLAFYGTFLGGMSVLVLIFDRVGKLNPQVTRNILLLTIALLIWFAAVLITDAFMLTELPLRIALAGIFALLIWLSTRFQSDPLTVTES